MTNREERGHSRSSDSKQHNQKQGQEVPTEQQEENSTLEDSSQKADQSNKTEQTTTIKELELESLRKEVAEYREYKDKYLRLLADMENMRKRMQKEKQELTQYAVENVVIDFLPPIDNMESALRFAQQMSDEVKNWAVGFQMILTQFKDALINNGVAAVDSQGNPFDPHTHEAVEMIETTEYPSGTVVEECVRGYKMGERIIRPARVKVAKSVSTDIQEQKTEETKTD